jgi:hypothetical protein
VKPSETVEGRLADMIEKTSVNLGHDSYSLSDEERMIVVKCLRERARWMASDIKSGERKSSKRQNRQPRS